MVDGHPQLQRNDYTHMSFDFQLNNGISLHIAGGTSRKSTYPTARIQKGLLLLFENQDLSEEAVGFGVPVVKRGLQAIFPGELEIFPHDQNPVKQITARYNMNLEERIRQVGSGIVNNRLVYSSKNIMAALIRNLPFMRGILTRTSNLLRASLGWETTYEPISYFTHLALNYSIEADKGLITVELIGQKYISRGISEIIVMNELGANYFDHYADTDGNHLSGKKIGCWNPVTATEASFNSSQHGITFSLSQVKGAKLFRGLELIDKRLAWAGFGYTFPPTLEHFNYSITIKKLL